MIGKLVRIEGLVLVVTLIASAQTTSSIPGAKPLVFEPGPVIEGLEGSIARSQRLQCDAAGDIYLPMERNGPGSSGFLERISPQGIPQTSFANVDSGEGFGEDGSIVMVGHGGRSLVKFSPQGKPSQVRISGWPEIRSNLRKHSAPFPNGNVLVTFRKFPQELRTGILDSKGNLIKEIRLPDDDDIQKAAANRDWRYVFPTYPDRTNMAIDMGQTLAGPDGNVYVLRWSSPALVYVIAPSGEMIRRLELQGPTRTMMPYNVQVIGGRIVLEFAGDDGHTVSIHDLQTGSRLQVYDVKGAPGRFGCYDPGTERLIFLDSSEKQTRMYYGHATVSTSQLH